MNRWLLRINNKMAERSLNATLYGLIIILQIIQWQKVEICNDLIFKAIVFGDSGGGRSCLIQKYLPHRRLYG